MNGADRQRPGPARRTLLAALRFPEAVSLRAMLGGAYVVLMARLVGRGLDILDLEPATTATTVAAGWTVAAAGAAWILLGAAIAVRRGWADPFWEPRERLVGIVAFSILSIGGLVAGAPMISALGAAWAAAWILQMRDVVRTRACVGRSGVVAASVAAERRAGGAAGAAAAAFRLWDLRDEVAERVADEMLLSIRPMAEAGDREDRP